MFKIDLYGYNGGGAMHTRTLVGFALKFSLGGVYVKSCLSKKTALRNLAFQSRDGQSEVLQNTPAL